jgi:hypothetical protein
MPESEHLCEQDFFSDFRRLSFSVPKPASAKPTMA